MDEFTMAEPLRIRSETFNPEMPRWVGLVADCIIPHYRMLPQSRARPQTIESFSGVRPRRSVSDGVDGRVLHPSYSYVQVLCI